MVEKASYLIAFPIKIRIEPQKGRFSVSHPVRDSKSLITTGGRREVGGSRIRPNMGSRRNSFDGGSAHGSRRNSFDGVSEDNN